MVRFVNLDTDEVIDREMTNAEFALYEAKEQLLVEQKTEAATKAAQRQALLTRLGITEDEARLLLS